MSVLWTVVAAGSVSVREGRRGRKELATSRHSLSTFVFLYSFESSDTNVCMLKEKAWKK